MRTLEEETARRRAYDAPWMAAHDLLSHHVSAAVWGQLVLMTREEMPQADLNDPEQLRVFLLRAFERATVRG